MENRLEHVRNVYELVAQAVGYMLAGMFLEKASNVSFGLTTSWAIVGQIIGLVFMALAFFIVIASNFDKLVKLFKSLESVLFTAFLTAALASLIYEYFPSNSSTSTLTPLFGSTTYIVIVAIFFVLVFFSIAFDFTKTIAYAVKHATLGNSLKTFGAISGIIVLLQILFKKEPLGGNLVWLGIGVLALGIGTIIQDKKEQAIPTFEIKVHCNSCGWSKTGIITADTGKEMSKTLEWIDKNVITHSHGLEGNLSIEYKINKAH